MKKRLLGALALSSLLLFSCETTTSVTTEGKVDTLYIKGDGPKVAWGVMSTGTSKSKDDVWVYLQCNAASLNEVPTAYVNNKKLDIDDPDLEDLIIGDLEFEDDRTFKANETVSFKTIVEDDTLESSFVVPPRITGLKCNGFSIPDSSSENGNNAIDFTEGSQSLVFSWDLPASPNKAKLYAYIECFLKDSDDDIDIYLDTIIDGNSFVLDLPSNLSYINYNNFSFSLTNTDQITSGDTPAIQTEKQNLYFQIEGSEWNFEFK